jgi:hypothetical protein
MEKMWRPVRPEHKIKIHIDRIASQGGMTFLLDQAFPGGPLSQANLHLHPWLLCTFARVWGVGGSNVRM